MNNQERRPSVSDGDCGQSEKEGWTGRLLEYVVTFYSQRDPFYRKEHPFVGTAAFKLALKRVSASCLWTHGAHRKGSVVPCLMRCRKSSDSWLLVEGERLWRAARAAWIE